MFDEKKSLIAFYELLKSFKGKRTGTIVFEAYLSNGGSIKFRAKEPKEKLGNVVFLKAKKDSA